MYTHDQPVSLSHMNVRSFLVTLVPWKRYPRSLELAMFYGFLILLAIPALIRVVVTSHKSPAQAHGNEVALK